MQTVGEEQQITQGHDAAHGYAESRSDGRSLHSHTKGEDEDPVEHGIQHTGDDVAPHGHLGRPVQTDDEQADETPHLEDEAGDYPQQVVANL